MSSCVGITLGKVWKLREPKEKLRVDGPCSFFLVSQISKLDKLRPVTIRLYLRASSSSCFAFRVSNNLSHKKKTRFGRNSETYSIYFLHRRQGKRIREG